MLRFRSLLRNLTGEQYEDVINVCSMLPIVEMKVKPHGEFGQCRFLGNCPPTPPLSHHFAISEQFSVNACWGGGGSWAVFQKSKLIREFILGRFPFVRTDKPDLSSRNENFTFNQNYPARSVIS